VAEDPADLGFGRRLGLETTGEMVGHVLFEESTVRTRAALYRKWCIRVGGVQPGDEENLGT